MITKFDGSGNLISCQYEYFLKDHPPGGGQVLGNTRVTFCELQQGIAQELQEEHYYPFGMPIAGLSWDGYKQLGSGTSNKYKYNGKEWQCDEFGSEGLDWYDYGARFYDPTVGRFWTQDAYAEKYHWMSPFQYAANNPIKFIDVNGDSIWVSWVIQSNGKDVEYKYKYTNGKLWDSNGKEWKGKNAYLCTVRDQLNQLKKDDGYASSLINDLEENKYENIITNSGHKAENDENQTNPTNYWSNLNNFGQDSELQYDPFSWKDPKKDAPAKERAPRVGLIHELKHVEQINNGTMNMKKGEVKLSNGMYTNKAEVEARHLENSIRTITKDLPVAE